MDRRSFWERRVGSDPADGVAAFEETYPRYEFAELVRLALAAGAWLDNVRRRVKPRQADASTTPLPGKMTPAE